MIDGEDVIKLFPNVKKPWVYCASLITLWYKDKKGEYVLTDDGLSCWQAPERKPMGQDRVEKLQSCFIISVIYTVNLSFLLRDRDHPVTIP